ncbi:MULTISPECIES: hypothetical protein [Actinomycetaceae]|uniref:hypothetical protein n=1 Tax=Actinomycetaceae TaxID=2049 RepID=UPI0008A4F5CC|nr:MULTISPECIES: hypothetical protein [Actinomycetaceae]MDP9833762.1 hypothetical protein [Gleimia europaea]OFJ62546.1 hypothetical protein HMPREF2854_03825 [Actinomyces sp. HMSC075B09]
MSRPDPEELRPLTLHERWALDTGGTVTGKGKIPKEIREDIKKYEAEDAKRAKEAAKISAVPSPEEGSAPEQQ